LLQKNLHRTFAFLILASFLISLFPHAFADNPGTYVWLTWPIDEDWGNYNFDIDIQILDAPQQVGQGVYWAHQFAFQHTSGGYIGLQIGTTWGSPPAGNGALFAIWEATSATPGPGAECVHFTTEGTGWSCHLPYAWRFDAKYRLRIWIYGEDAENWGWLGTVFDYETNRETTIGIIKAPKRLGELGQSSVTWTEYFGVDWKCEPPHTLAVFSNPRVRNGQVDQANGALPYKAMVAYGQTCGKSSNVKYLGGAYYALEAGPKVQRVTPEGSWLWTSTPTSIEATEPIPEFSKPGLLVALIAAASLITFISASKRKRRSG